MTALYREARDGADRLMNCISLVHWSEAPDPRLEPELRELAGRWDALARSLNPTASTLRVVGGTEFDGLAPNVRVLAAELRPLLRSGDAAGLAVVVARESRERLLSRGLRAALGEGPFGVLRSHVERARLEVAA